MRTLLVVLVAAFAVAPAGVVYALVRHGLDEAPPPPILSHAPGYVLDYAPILHLDGTEPYVPIDADAYVRHTELVDVDELPGDVKHARAIAILDGRSVGLTGLPAGTPTCAPPAVRCHYALKVSVPRPHAERCRLLRLARILCISGWKRYRTLQKALLRQGAVRTVYWRPVVSGGRVVGVQYWFFYVFNRWLNWHEGDWEQITLRFEPDGRVLAGFSAHKRGHQRELAPGDGMSGTHPVVFVARGSHANYFDKLPHAVDEVPGFIRSSCKPLPPAHNPCFDHSDGKGAVLMLPQYRLARIGGPLWPRYSGDFGSGNFAERGVKCVPKKCFFDYSVNVRNPTQSGKAWNTPLNWIADAPPGG